MRRAEQMRFLISYAETLQAHGAAAHVLESSVQRRARAIGLPLRVAAAPTFLLFEREGRTHLSDVSAGWVDLSRLAEAEQVADRVCAGALEPARAMRDLSRGGPRYGPLWQLAAGVLVAATTAPFFGGDLRACLAAAAGGLATGLGLELAGRARRRGHRLPETTVAALMGTAWVQLTARWLGADPEPALLAGLIALMPGFSATIAAAELSAGHLVAGMARLAGALTTLVQLAIGVVLAIALVGAAASPASAGVLPPWALRAAALGSAPGFVVMLGARPRAILPVAAGIALAWQADARVASWLHPVAGAACGAWAVALLGQLWRRLSGAAPEVVAVPGLLLLVPGASSFAALAALVEGDVVGGIEKLVVVVLSAVALAAGYLAGSGGTR